MNGICYTAKSEIASVVLRSRHEKIAFLSAVIHTAGAIIISNGEIRLSLETESDFIKDCLDKVIKEIYKNTSHSAHFRNISLIGSYLDRLLFDCKILALKEDDGGRSLVLGIDPSLIINDNAGIAYIKGAFLGSGSLSLSSGYHLEFSLSNEVLALDLKALLNKKKIAAKITKRKDKFIVYIKSAEAVSDVLALMGAPVAVLKINEKIAMRHVSGLSNRRLNCDMANIDKTVNTAQNQIEAITALKMSGKFSGLDSKLIEAGEARLNFPDAPTSELASMLNISKSGLIHRLNKIILLAQIEKQ